VRNTAAAAYDFTLKQGSVTDNGDHLIVRGYASNFDVDRVGDQVTRRALEAALVGYMRNPMLLWNHKFSRPAGKVTEARVDDHGLYIEAKIPKPADRDAENLTWWQMVRDGYLKALSIGGHWVRERVNGVNQLVRIDLREISLAPVGVNAGTMLFSDQIAKAFGDPEPVDPVTLARLQMICWRARLERMHIERAAPESASRSQP
jgi:HK97 family phage prohead protease